MGEKTCKNCVTNRKGGVERRPYAASIGSQLVGADDSVRPDDKHLGC